MKNVIKKLAISIILVITVAFTFSVVFETRKVQADWLEDEFALVENEGVGGAILDGIVGIVLYIPKAIAYAIISLVRVIVAGISAIGGGDAVWSIESIIFTGSRKEGFTGINLVDIDFFSTSGNSTINTFRTNVATWYYALRNLSIVILLGILLYVGIRMAISTVADEKAKYKTMLKDWIVSLALVFVLHFIMICTIEINNTLVTIIHNGINQGTTANNWEDAMNFLQGQVWNYNFSVGWGALIVYGILVGVTIIYLFMYIKRMLTVAFLIIIAPLITITYSIDKIGDGKSQALNNWLKEFIFNILIQPFHCIIYIVFVQVAIGLMKDATSLSASILAVIMLLFMHKAEEIIKQIFHFQSPSLASAIGSTAAITAGLSFMQKKGNDAAKKDVNTKKIPNMDAPSKGGNGSNSGSKNAGNKQSNTANNNMNEASNTTNSQSNGQAEQPQDLWSRDINGDFAKDVGRRVKNTAKTIPGRMKNAGINMIKNAPKNALKLATYATLATLGAAAGGKGLSAGLYAASAINKGISSKLNRKQANKIVEDNEKKYAGAYKNFQTKSGKSDKEMETYTRQIMNGDVDTEKMTNDEREYASYVRKMQETYKAVGEDDVEDRMLETIAMVNGGEIEPEYGELPQVEQSMEQSPETGEPQDGKTEEQAAEIPEVEKENAEENVKQNEEQVKPTIVLPDSSNVDFTKLDTTNVNYEKEHAKKGKENDKPTIYIP